ncbi:DNA-processing protein DprA [Agrobacterium pusense]|uniref:DNA-processing protein DprA n=1 Tax=Agrobacterium pusense TaxID=648995 RepID=UPI001DB0BF41|nr:DNA-processing protein DprA [Agrobacterium pusense]MBP2611445.1 DNA processing protein [Agrobacterium pusense]
MLDMGSDRKTAMNAALPEPMVRKSRYVEPQQVTEIALGELLIFAGRPMLPEQAGLFKKPEERDPIIFCAGDLDLLKRRSISVIGARSASPEALMRASRIARELSAAGIVVTSGLAKGIDTAAHTSAIKAGGRTVSVIGTPLDKAYPAENADLQRDIYEHHLLISQFHPGQRTFQSDFPKRNRLMAALSDGSVIVEASDTSGTLHQASECIRLGRWLFIMKSVMDNKEISWPERFRHEPRTVVLTSVEDILTRLV